VIWAVVAFAGVAVGLAGAVAALGIELGREKSSRTKAEAGRDRALEMHAQAVRDLGAESVRHVDDVARLDAVIAAQKTGIAKLEEDLDACEDPAVVRDRLRGLLRGAASGPGPAASAAGAGLQAGSAAGLGDGRGDVRGRG
jgi:hypothetical protein